MSPPDHLGPSAPSIDAPSIDAPSIDAVVALGRVAGVARAPAGDVLIVARAQVDARRNRYRHALWRVPVDGSPASLLLPAEHNPRAPAFRADGRLYFLAEVEVEDGEGTKRRLDQVHRLAAADVAGDAPVEVTAARVLTDAPRGVTAFRVASDGERLAWVAPRRPGVAPEDQRTAWLREQTAGPGPRHFHAQPVRWWDRWLGRDAPALFVADTDDAVAAARRLGPDDVRALHEVGWDLSADGRVLVHTVARPGPDRLADLDLWIHDLDAGTRRVLDAAPASGWTRPSLSPDGRHLALCRNGRQPGRRGPDELHLVDLAPSTLAPRRLAGDWDRWPEPAAWADGELVVTVREDARQRLYALDPDTGARRLLVGDGSTEVDHATGGLLVGRHHDLRRPPTPVVVDAATGRTARLDPGLDDPGLPALHVEERWIDSPAGGRTHTLVLRPAARAGPLPLLLWVHGGPVSHWADWWHWRWNAAVFAAHGYAVALPNPRGSTGYGQDWVEGIWNDCWGGACVDDLLAVRDALCAEPGVDAERVALMGASFGGWMANRLAGLDAAWRCVVTHASIFDDRSFAGSTDLPPFWAWEHGGTPWDRADYGRWSPDRVVDGWRAPTLVIHGEADYRVPLEQGLSLFEALQHHGVDVELLAFPDEGHWIMRPDNVAAWHRVVLEFLARHVGGRGPRGGQAPPPGW